jgi:plasmid stabilization system protein ParE
VKLRLTAQALNELVDAALFYVEESPQAALQFDKHIEEAFERILDNPSVYPRVSDGIQYKVLDKFPFTIYFVRRKDEIQVFSIAHHKKMPPPWRG